MKASRLRQYIIRFRQGLWWIVPRDGSPALRICGLFDQTGWNVGGLCSHLQISRRTFDRIAEESLGIPAKRWLRELRMVRARHRLREGATVKEVSTELGFRHPTSFAREFKNLMEVTPSAFQAAERRRRGQMREPEHEGAGQGSGAFKAL